MDVPAACVCGAWRGDNFNAVSVCGPKLQRAAVENLSGRAVPVIPA